jgi:hypothetical protein
MLFVLITSAKVVHKTKTHYTINNIFSIILINLSATKYCLQLMSDDYILELHRVVILCAILIHIHHSYSPLENFRMSCPSAA